MKKFLKRAFGLDRLVGLGLLAALLLVSRLDPYPVQFLREKSFDIYQQMMPRKTPDPKDRLVTIIDIDERSLQEVGQWPWSRKTVAELVVALHNMGVGVTAFDVVFAEPDRMNPSGVVDSLVGLDESVREKILKLESNDETLGRIVSQANVVLGQAGYWDQLPNKAGKPFRKSVAVRKLTKDAPEPTDFLTEVPTLIRNLAVLEKGAKGVGVFSLNPSLDGIIREVPMVTRHDEALYPALSVEAIRVGFQVSTLMAEVDDFGIKGIGVAPKSKVKPKGLKINTNERGLVRPYFAPHDKRLYVSAVDVLKGTVDKSLIAGKIAFVGTSAVGLLDIRSTPIDPLIPGVEVHAQVVENALAIDRELGAVVAAEQFLTRPNLIKGAEILSIAFGGLLMIILAPMLGATRSLFVFVIVAGSAASTSWYLFTHERILLDATFAVVSTFLLYSTLTYMNFTREEAAKKQTRDAFSKYLSPDMVNVVAENPDQLKLGGQKREMTLLFCDVRGFTTISEQFDAEGLTKLINKLLTPLTNVILARRGTIDKYMGDCIMAFWNAPLDDPEHAKHGCLSALAMLKEMEPLNSRLEQEAKDEGRKHIPLKVGLGLNSGECVVGNMGSDQRFDYSVLGDTVNLASRLEGQSKTYGVHVVIGDKTHAQVPTLATIELDLIKVKGKLEAVRIFALIGDEDMAVTPEFKTFKTTVDDMLAKYRAQDWDGAQAACDACRAMADTYECPGFFDLYEQRIHDMRANPPGADWDGVFVATSK
ncbi:MAG: adenylate/guanylate cyclase domain-containing protein [Alphaproteobacteria bacterium]|nr:adenylate/guanylate cyclase domain-containing protein [Alphaproteobacteria bacterium]MBF0252012.1 adenylate/guanylate cyclase domain-containing protein [Alphaproteobacteria bacterium]